MYLLNVYVSMYVRFLVILTTVINLSIKILITSVAVARVRSLTHSTCGTQLAATYITI